MSAALVEDFNRRRAEYWRTQHDKRRAEQAARVSPRNPVASNVNFDCSREMYYGITDPLVRPDPEIASAERMEDGNVAADAARHYCEDLGYQVIETEGPIEPFRNAKGQVVYTGRIDFLIQLDGQKIPVEVKSVSEYVFGAINTFEDLDRFWWTRKYKGQILIYLLQKNATHGVLLLRHRGQHKMIAVALEDHLEEAEIALRLGETVTAAVAKKTPPPFATDPTTCRHCWAFGRICQPPIEEQGAVMLDESGELYELLTIEAENAGAHRRYEAAKKRRNEILKAIVPQDAFAKAKPKETFFRALCGDFAIALMKRFRKGYVVKDVEYQEADIVRAGAAAQEEVA